MTTPHPLPPDAVKRPWRQFLDTYEALRPELYRYCRHLTRSPWDAEDLAQDTLARAYYERLMARPAFARVLEEAKPLMHLFPG